MDKPFKQRYIIIAKRMFLLLVIYSHYPTAILTSLLQKVYLMGRTGIMLLSAQLNHEERGFGNHQRFHEQPAEKPYC